ncbi:hypothetical protein BJV82DRAFT_587824 [Fennellomyces sp. T-0311]|nr:hypothetical protein BJV82DRAFT_587824 [Fennellomyces sp. T-0311]
MKFPYKLDNLTWIDKEHSRNKENMYCYCGEAFTEDKPMTRCESCRQLFHAECIKCLPKPLLFGDNFLSFRCSVCTQGVEEYIRHSMSWVAVVHLVIYNLMQRQDMRDKDKPADQKGQKYFRWKDDICTFIDDYWDYLVPGKKRSVTWHNTIASVLSTHSTIFKSGYEIFHQSAWWSLHEQQPPSKDKARTSKVKAAPKSSQKRSRSDTEPAKYNKATKKAKFDVEGEQVVEKKPKLVKKGRRKEQKASDELEVPLKEEDEIFNMSSLSELSSEDELFGDDDPVSAPNVVAQKPSEKSETNQTALNAGRSHSEAPVEPNNVKDPVPAPETNPSKGAAIELNASEDIEKADDETSEAPASKPSQSLYLSQQEEWQLLQKLENATKKLPAPALRYQRKLAVRRLKRNLGLKLFDIDTYVSRQLRSRSELSPMSKQGVKVDDVVGDQAQDKENEESKQFERIVHTPYRSSFAHRLYGSIRQDSTVTRNKPWLSSWNGRKLRPFIRRDFQSRPAMMQLLHEIVACGGKPQRHPLVSEYTASIDYVYFQPQHLEQANIMLRRCFWEGIDVSESLLFPEFSIVALYKQSVIGCAFMTPDAYITYIAVLPGWDKSGVGQFMLYHLFQTAISKDITLHVSANNSAMILYQKFGFKPEEFIVDFYDKYLPPDSVFSKNAFLLRLRR